MKTKAVSFSAKRLCVRLRLVGTIMLLTIFVAASNGPSAAESSTTEDQAGEMTVLEEAEQTVRADHSDTHQRANDCIEFEEGQSMTLRGKIVQKATTEPEEGEPPHKYMVIELEDSICFKNAPDIKIDVVTLTVAKKWVSRHVVVTGSMEGGLMWSIKVSEIVDEKKVSR
jgi:hypothetical protein